MNHRVVLKNAVRRIINKGSFRRHPFPCHSDIIDYCREVVSKQGLVNIHGRDLSTMSLPSWIKLVSDVLSELESEGEVAKLTSGELARLFKNRKLPVPSYVRGGNARRVFCVPAKYKT